MVLQGACITIHDTCGDCRMNQMNLYPKRLQRTLEMRMTCGACYDQYKCSVNSIGSESRGDMSISTNVVTWTPRERPTCHIGDKEKLFPWHLFEDLRDVHMKREKLIIFSNKLLDLVAVLPNHRTFYGSHNPLGVQPMHRAREGISSL